MGEVINYVDVYERWILEGKDERLINKLVEWNIEEIKQYEQSSKR